MGQAIMEESHLKEIMKKAIVEVFEERRDMLSDLVMEALEDLALIRAIKEGEKSGSVSKEKVFNILEGKV